MENNFPVYSAYTFFPNTFVSSINISYDFYEQMSTQINQQFQEISDLKKENELLKNLLKQSQLEKSCQKQKSEEVLVIKESQTIIKKVKPERTFFCDYENCDRVYASTLALNLHIKTKHNGGTKKQRDAYAKLIVMAELNGQTKPEINFAFPNNYIENFKQKFLSQQNFKKNESYQVRSRNSSVSQAF